MFKFKYMTVDTFRIDSVKHQGQGQDASLF